MLTLFFSIPGDSEVCHVTNDGSGRSGAWGTAAWDVYCEEERIVVMWYVPLSHDTEHNWLAVGTMKTEELHDM